MGSLDVLLRMRLELQDPLVHGVIRGRIIIVPGLVLGLEVALVCVEALVARDDFVLLLGWNSVLVGTIAIRAFVREILDATRNTG